MVTLIALTIALIIACWFFIHTMLRGFEQGIKWFDHKNVRKQQPKTSTPPRNASSTKARRSAQQKIEDEEEWPEVITL